MPTVQLTLCIDIDVTYFEDRSGLSPSELVAAVMERVKDERETLATESKIAALNILNGDNEKE